MELVIIFSTITAFFSHYLIEKTALANAVSAIVATVVMWMLVGTAASIAEGVLIRDLSITVVIALVVSMIVGLVFSAHKKCSK
jgi:hypothetical protein